MLPVAHRQVAIRRVRPAHLLTPLRHVQILSRLLKAFRLVQAQVHLLLRDNADVFDVFYRAFGFHGAFYAFARRISVFHRLHLRNRAKALDAGVVGICWLHDRLVFLVDTLECALDLRRVLRSRDVNLLRLLQLIFCRGVRLL